MQRELEPLRGSGEEARAEFSAFFQAAYPRLVGQLHAIGGSVPQAHDAVQEAFARAWQRWSMVREFDDPVGWVRTVALRTRVPRSHRLLAAVGLKRGPGLSVPVSAMDPQNLVVLDALRRLPDTQRRALVLRHMARLEVWQIADQEGVAQDTVRSRMAQGREALVGLLVDDLDPIERLEGVQG